MKEPESKSLLKHFVLTTCITVSFALQSWRNPRPQVQHMFSCWRHHGLTQYFQLLSTAQPLGLALPNPLLAACAKTHRLGSTPFGDILGKIWCRYQVHKHVCDILRPRGAWRVKMLLGIRWSRNPFLCCSFLPCPEPWWYMLSRLCRLWIKSELAAVWASWSCVYALWVASAQHHSRVTSTPLI